MFFYPSLEFVTALILIVIASLICKISFSGDFVFSNADEHRFCALIVHVYGVSSVMILNWTAKVFLHNWYLNVMQTFACRRMVVFLNLFLVSPSALTFWMESWFLKLDFSIQLFQVGSCLHISFWTIYWSYKLFILTCVQYWLFLFPLSN